MKHLIVVRHAKAVDCLSNSNDFNRPLTPKGIDRLLDQLSIFSENKYDVDVIITSPAVRTLSTATIVAEFLGLDCKKIILDKRLYQSSAKTLKIFLNELFQIEKNILLVGHNPILEYWVSSWSNAPTKVNKSDIFIFQYDKNRIILKEKVSYQK